MFDCLTRRRALGASVAAASLVAAPAWALTRTPRQTRGPFYPAELPLDRDNDLVTVEGAAGPADGEIIHVTGRVLAGDGTPFPGTKVEIWQADAAGTYRHPRDSGPADPGFQGFGQAIADGEGAWRFRTIRPAPYGWRTPHIHFRVLAPGRDELITQMYFAGEPRNAQDGLHRGLRSEEARQAVTIAFEPGEDGVSVGYFPIVLA